MKVQKINTRFMEGNKDIEGIIFDILIENYGHTAVFSSGIDFDEVIFSNGFIHAIEMGLMPTLEIKENYLAKGEKEYHHFIENDKCYIMYFNN